MFQLLTKHNLTHKWIKSLLPNTTNYVTTDPSMTVRADISGRYSNRLYAYEPNDAKLCKQHTKSFTQICPLPFVLAFMKNRLITCKCFPFPPSVMSNMKKAKKLLKSELWVRGWETHSSSDSHHHHKYAVPTVYTRKAKHWEISVFHLLLKCLLTELPSWLLPLLLLLYIQNVFWINTELFIKTRWIVCLYANI